MFKSTIVVKDDVAALEELFTAEQKDLGRSRFTISKKNGQLVFDVTADDATAFKTVMNTLAKIFTVWEKSKKVIENGS